MTLQETTTQLESLSDEKVFTRNKKHGAGDDQYGIKLGDLRKLAKKIKTDHRLALQLWDTKMMEARLLAILIMNSEDLSAQNLDKMVKSIQTPQVADWFNAYVLKNHPEKEQLREEWSNDKNIWAARSGWSLTAGKASREPQNLDLDRLLDRIEKDMPTAPPEVQWTMNTALAQIGINSPEHTKRATNIGEELGIYRDYPVSKGCTSPFAPLWINEMLSRKKK